MPRAKKTAATVEVEVAEIGNKTIAKATAKRGKKESTALTVCDEKACTTRFIAPKYVERRRLYGRYRHIGKGNTLSLMGAKRFLAGEGREHFMYLPTLHIAGHKKELEKFLKEQGVSASEIKEHLARGFGRKHLESKEFAEALLAAKIARAAHREHLSKLKMARETGAHKRRSGSPSAVLEAVRAASHEVAVKSPAKKSPKKRAPRKSKGTVELPRLAEF